MFLLSITMHSILHFLTDSVTVTPANSWKSALILHEFQLSLFVLLKRGRRPLGRGGRADTLPISSSGTTPHLGREDVKRALPSSSLLEEQCMAEQGQARLTAQQYWSIRILEMHIFAIWYIFVIKALMGRALGISPALLPIHYPQTSANTLPFLKV